MWKIWKNMTEHVENMKKYAENTRNMKKYMENVRDYEEVCEKYEGIPSMIIYTIGLGKIRNLEKFRAFPLCRPWPAM